MTIYEPANNEGVTKRRTLERAKRVTRRRTATKRAKHHGHGDVSCCLDAACFAKLFVLHIVLDERHTRQRKMLRTLLVCGRTPRSTQRTAARVGHPKERLKYVVR